MRYRTRTGKQLSDQNVISDLGKGTKNILSGSPSIFGDFIFGIFNYVVGGAAFISRCLLRIRLGERTFGLLTVVSIFFLAWLIFNIPPLLENTQAKFSITNNSDSIGNHIIAFFIIPYYLIMMSLRPEEELNKLFVDLPTEVYIFIGLVMIVGIFHLVEVYSRNTKKELVNSYYRGDSLFFGWLEGKKIFRIKISMTRIWMFIEPLFILFIAYLVREVLNYNDVALVLTISAGCLFLEEFRVYQENRRIELNLIDGWLDAHYVSNMHKQFQDVLANENKESPKDFNASFGQGGQGVPNSSGSDSPFRASIY